MSDDSMDDANDDIKLDLDSQIILLGEKDRILAHHLGFSWERKVDTAEAMAEDGALAQWPDAPVLPFITFARDNRPIAAFWVGQQDRDVSLVAARLIASSLRATSIYLTHDARRTLNSCVSPDLVDEDGLPMMLNPITGEPFAQGDLHTPEMAVHTIDCLVTTVAAQDGSCRMINRDYTVQPDGTVVWGELEDHAEDPDKASQLYGEVPDRLRSCLLGESFVDAVMSDARVEAGIDISSEDLDRFAAMFATAFTARVIPNSQAVLIPTDVDDAMRMVDISPLVEEFLQFTTPAVQIVRQRMGITDDD